MPNPNDLLKNILTDIKVELTDEFDRNFERKAFFDRPWPKRGQSFGGSLLVKAGRLRRSIRGSVGGNSVTWKSDAPYAAIHNAGGKIPVTPQMRKYFWAKYYERAGGVTKLKSGKASASKRNIALSAEAQFYKNMALTKKDAITIPRRQFIGDHPKVKEAVENIANKNINRFLNDLAKSLKK